jgi:hypothetical protein
VVTCACLRWNTHGAGARGREAEASTSAATAVADWLCGAELASAIQ